MNRYEQNAIYNAGAPSTKPSINPEGNAGQLAYLQAQLGHSSERLANNYAKHNQYKFGEKFPQNPSYNPFPQTVTNNQLAVNPTAINLEGMGILNIGDLANQQVGNNQAAQDYLTEGNLDYAQFYLGRELTPLEISSKIVNADYAQNSEEFLNHAQRYVQFEPNLLAQLQDYLKSKLSGEKVINHHVTLQKKGNNTSNNEIAQLARNLNKLKVKQMDTLISFYNIPLFRSKYSKAEKRELIEEFFRKNADISSQIGYQGLRRTPSNSDEEQKEYHLPANPTALPPIQLRNLADEENINDVSFNLNNDRERSEDSFHSTVANDDEPNEYVENDEQKGQGLKFKYKRGNKKAVKNVAFGQPTNRKIKERFKILIGEISAGNDSRKLRTELGNLLNVMVSKKLLTRQKANSYAKRFLK